MDAEVFNEIQKRAAAGRGADALALASRYATEHPADMEAWNLLPDLAVQCGLSDECIEELKRAAGRFADNPSVWTSLGDALSINEEPEEAIAAYERALEFLPVESRDRRADVYTCIACEYEALGDAESAESFHRKATETAPDNVFSRDELERFSLDQDEDEDGGAFEVRDPGQADMADMQAIATEHPELSDALARGEHMVDEEGKEFSPMLHVTIHQIIRNQVRQDDPPGIRDIFETLLQCTGDRHAAEHEIGGVLVGHLHVLLHDREAFNAAQYLTDLRIRINDYLRGR